MIYLATTLLFGSFLAAPSPSAARVAPNVAWQDDQTPAAGHQAAEPPKSEQAPEANEAPVVPSTDAAEEKGAESNATPPAPQSTPAKPGKKPAPAKTKKAKTAKAHPVGETDTTKKKVVKNGSTADPVVELGPGLSQQQESNQLSNTHRLLDATNANLKKISGKQLEAKQKDVLRQIHLYVQQATRAETEGDLQVAHNLALKAQLLSEQLVKD